MLKMNTAITITGRARPSAFFTASARPNEKPFFRNRTPTPIPAAKPIRATQALRSPPAIRRTMRNGQPKKIRQPIIITKPRTKRVKGEEPAVALNSLFAKAITQAPTMIPMISGRRYCTVSLVCSFIAPAVSRTKQAMQIAMLPGLPLDASMMATAAATTPHTTRITRSLVSEFTQVSFIEGERAKPLMPHWGMAQFARHNRKPTTRAGMQKR